MVKAPIPRYCLTCKNPLTNRKQTKFCSKSCSSKSSERTFYFGTKQANCHNCKELFEVDKRASPKTCCKPCQKLKIKLAKSPKVKNSYKIAKAAEIKIFAKDFEIPKETYEEEVDRKFFGRILKEDFGKQCWIWQGSKSSEGYGQVTIQGKTIGTHRFSYKYHKKIDPGKYLVCHTCDNPPCVNPNHLWLGTDKDNVQDMIAKNRQNHMPRQPWKRYSLYNPRNINQLKFKLRRKTATTK